MVAVELGTGGAGGGVSALGECGSQRRVSPSGVAGAALAGAGVVAGRDAGPGAGVAWVVESGHIRADLDQGRAGAGEVDTGNGRCLYT